MNQDHQSNPLTPFLFGENTVRTIVLKGNPWFVTSDVCTIIGIDNNRQAIAFLDEDEKGVITSDTLGGPQKTSIISEMGVYRLIFKSRKTAARDFQRWVFHEVLPAIRRTGAYSAGQVSFVGFVKELIGLGCSADLALRAAMRQSPVAGAARKLEAVTDAPLVPIERDAAEVVALMEDGRTYGIPALVALLPKEGLLARKFKGLSEMAQKSKMGWLMRAAAKRGLVDKCGSTRAAAFVRPDPGGNIVEIGC